MKPPSPLSDMFALSVATYEALTRQRPFRGSSDGEIFTIIQEGAGPKSVMKAFNKKITEQDAWNLVNYLHSLRRNGTK